MGLALLLVFSGSARLHFAARVLAVSPPPPPSESGDGAFANERTHVAFEPFPNRLEVFHYSCFAVEAVEGDLQRKLLARFSLYTGWIHMRHLAWGGCRCPFIRPCVA